MSSRTEGLQMDRKCQNSMCRKCGKKSKADHNWGNEVEKKQLSLPQPRSVPVQCISQDSAIFLFWVPSLQRERCPCHRGGVCPFSPARALPMVTQAPPPSPESLLRTESGSARIFPRTRWWHWATACPGTDVFRGTQQTRQTSGGKLGKMLAGQKRDT